MSILPSKDRLGFIWKVYYYVFGFEKNARIFMFKDAASPSLS